MAKNLPTINCTNSRPVESIIEAYSSEGIIVCRHFANSPKEFRHKVETDFQTEFAPEASRRKSVGCDTEAPMVDTGNHFIPFHSEATFARSWPKTLWFWCEAADDEALSLVVDGCDVWESLSPVMQKRAVEYPLEYHMQLPVIPVLDRDSEDYIDKTGFMQNARLNWRKGVLDYQIFRSGVVEVADKIAFCNHSMITNAVEPMLVNLLWGKRAITNADRSDLTEACLMNEIAIALSPGDAIVLHNQRWMHGRKQFREGALRKIRILQAKTSILHH